MQEWGEGKLPDGILEIDASIQKLQTLGQGDPMGTWAQQEAILTSFTEHMRQYPSLRGAKPLVVLGGSLVSHDFMIDGSSDIDVACLSMETIPNKDILRKPFTTFNNPRVNNTQVDIYSIAELEQMARFARNPEEWLQQTYAGVAAVITLTGKPLFPIPENILAHAELRKQVKKIIIANERFREEVYDGLQSGLKKRLQRREGQ